jgi:hypothetical protein
VQPHLRRRCINRTRETLLSGDAANASVYVIKAIAAADLFTYLPNFPSG